MKYIFGFIWLLCVLKSNAQQPFVTTWQISSIDINLAIIIPTNTDDYTYNYTVDFENINLPFKNTDPDGSKGYFNYKIKPKSTVQIGNTFENTAYIYFDFNQPILTNTVVNTVVDELNVSEFDINPIKLYPNPIKDKLYIDREPNIKLNSFELFDIQGKLIKRFNTQNALDFSPIPKGVYVLRLGMEKGIYNYKVVKE